METHRKMFIAIAVLCLILVIISPRPSAIASSLFRYRDRFQQRSGPFLRHPRPNSRESASKRSRSERTDDRSTTKHASSSSASTGLLKTFRNNEIPGIICNDSFVIPGFTTAITSGGNFPAHKSSVTPTPPASATPSLSPCYVRAPVGYARPYATRVERLWRVNRANLGSVPSKALKHASTTSTEFNFFPNISSETFTHARNIVSILASFPSPRCNSTSTPLSMLHLFASTGSFAASVTDPRYISAKINLLSLVALRSPHHFPYAALLAERGLPAFVHDLTPASSSLLPLPLPHAAFDVVYCNGCWNDHTHYWLGEVQRILVPGGHFVYKNMSFQKGEPWGMVRANGMRNWKCTRTSHEITVCRKLQPEVNLSGTAGSSRSGSSTCSIAQEVTTSTAERSALAAVDNDVISAFSTMRINANTNVKDRDGDRRGQEDSHQTYSRILNLNCHSASSIGNGTLCWRIEQLLKPNVDVLVHTYSLRNEALLARMILAGSTGILYEWRDKQDRFQAMPFYPRAFDIVHLACEKEYDSEFVRDERLFIELHRVLAPRGILLLMKNTCALAERAIATLKKLPFDIVDSAHGVTVARRRDV